MGFNIFKKHLFNVKYWIIFFTFLVFFYYVEIYRYSKLPSFWNLPKENYDNDSVTRILLVADPQIIGLRNENHLFGFLTRWDSDRYLYKGFGEALKSTRPHIILFLGDLLDEGSIATEEEWTEYVGRFKKIFHDQAYNYQSQQEKFQIIPKLIHIPGDNDIGGEAFENLNHKSFELFKRHFQKHFKDYSCINLLNLTFYSMNEFGNSLVETNFINSLDNLFNSFKTPISILISHMTILRYYHHLHKEVKTLNPHLIISGHEHKSSYHSCYKCWLQDQRIVYHSFGSEQEKKIKKFGKKKKNEKEKKETDEEMGILEDDLGDRRMIYEITVPSCSYRMGVPNMGYGFLEIISSNQMKYRVLWLPRRYPILYFYLFLLSFFLVIIFFFFKKFFFQRKYVKI